MLIEFGWFPLFYTIHELHFLSKKPACPKNECVASCRYLNSFCSQTSGVTGSAESIDLSCIHVSTTNIGGFNDSLWSFSELQGCFRIISWSSDNATVNGKKESKW